VEVAGVVVLPSLFHSCLGDSGDQRRPPPEGQRRTCEDSMEQGRSCCQLYHNGACILGCVRDFYCELLVGHDRLRIDCATDAMAQHTLARI